MTYSTIQQAVGNKTKFEIVKETLTKNGNTSIIVKILRSGNKKMVTKYGNQELYSKAV